MLYSNLTAYFIILATAVTLHVSGITDIETAAQAASALRPLAGDFAFILFALGILGVGLIGVPVLAGSAAYEKGRPLLIQVNQDPSIFLRSLLARNGHAGAVAASPL
jgi:Mn2+/Fe2+ NRAMP family transporter